MKYTFGVLCILAGAWLVYRGIVHRRAVLAEQAALPADHPSPELTRRQQALLAMRTGLGPLFVLAVVISGIVLSGLWFVVDGGQVFSGLDVLGFMVVNLAYAFWMFVHMRHSRLGLTS
jgi:hypothetical protein